MQRTLAVVMIPGLVFLTLCILAMEPGRKDASSEDRQHVAVFEPGDTASVNADRTALKRGRKTLALLGKGTEFQVQQIKGPWVGGNTKVGGQTVSGWIHERELTNKTSTAGVEAQERSGPSDQPTTNDGPQESMGKKFARLMASEKAGITASGSSQSRETATSPASLERPARAGLTARSSVSDRKRLISTLPILVARTSGDLIELDATQAIGQLTVTGDQFSNRSLKYLAGLQILSISVEAVHVGNAGLIPIAKVKGLKELRLWAPGVTDDGLTPLAELDGLELLDLEGTSVQGTGLTEAGGFQNLSQLTLGPQTEDDDLSLVASIPSLVELDLRPCRRLTDGCLKLLAQHGQLAMIWLPPQVGSADRQATLDMLPNHQLRW